MTFCWTSRSAWSRRSAGEALLVAEQGGQAPGGTKQCGTTLIYCPPSTIPTSKHTRSRNLCACSSVVRPFRLAATITAAQLVSSWVSVEEALTEARNTADMQRRAEEARGVSAACVQTHSCDGPGAGEVEHAQASCIQKFICSWSFGLMPVSPCPAGALACPAGSCEAAVCHSRGLNAAQCSRCSTTPCLAGRKRAHKCPQAHTRPEPPSHHGHPGLHTDAGAGRVCAPLQARSRPPSVLPLLPHTRVLAAPRGRVRSASTLRQPPPFRGQGCV